MTGFWKAPRALARLLTARRLTPNECLLLSFVAWSGADRADGFETTNSFLAEALDIHQKTVMRALRSLRAQGYVDFDDHQGMAIFVVRTTAALAALEHEPGTPLGTPLGTRVGTPEAPLVSQVTSDTPPSSSSRKPASVKGSRGVATSDTSRARAETETETEIEKRPSGAQQLVAYYVDELKAIDAPAPKRLIGQVAKQVGELVREDVHPDTIAQALHLLVERRLHPSTLPSLVPEAAAGPGRRASGHPADRHFQDAFGIPPRELLP